MADEGLKTYPNKEKIRKATEIMVEPLQKYMLRIFDWYLKVGIKNPDGTYGKPPEKRVIEKAMNFLSRPMEIHELDDFFKGINNNISDVGQAFDYAYCRKNKIPAKQINSETAEFHNYLTSLHLARNKSSHKNVQSNDKELKDLSDDDTLYYGSVMILLSTKMNDPKVGIKLTDYLRSEFLINNSVPEIKNNVEEYENKIKTLQDEINALRNEKELLNVKLSNSNVINERNEYDITILKNMVSDKDLIIKMLKEQIESADDHGNRTNISTTFSEDAIEMIDPPETDDEWKEYGKTLMSKYLYGESLRILMPLAESGDAESQYLIGNMYYRGMGVKPSMAETIKWMEKASEQGYLPAMLRMYRFYHSESYLGIYRDLTPEERGYSPEKAKVMWQKLREIRKELPDDVDQVTLIGINRYGEDGRFNEERFMDFLKTESSNGNAHAMSILASHLAYDDVEESKRLYLEAGRLGDIGAMVRVCFNYTGKKKEDLEDWGIFGPCPEYSIEEFNECESWLRIVAKKDDEWGNSEFARALLGEYYLNEYLNRDPRIIGGTKYGSIEEAITLFRTSKVSDVSKYYLGEIYYFGYGVQRSIEKAVKWFKLAYKNKDKWYFDECEYEYSIYGRIEKILSIIDLDEDQNKKDTNVSKLCHGHHFHTHYQYIFP